MTNRVPATFTGGVFKPDESVKLPDQTRVQLTVEPINGHSNSAVAWQSIQKRLQQRPIHGGQHFPRDELHERR